uniref:Uncharacterized protein n=1 Tax=Anguilla anguilla TaxID=7936 RepID=A0A0E9WCP6_ANGAN
MSSTLYWTLVTDFSVALTIPSRVICAISTSPTLKTSSACLEDSSCETEQGMICCARILPFSLPPAKRRERRTHPATGCTRPGSARCIRLGST